MIYTQIKEKKNHKISIRLGERIFSELMEEALQESQNLSKYIISALEKRVKKAEILPKQKQEVKTAHSRVVNWFFGLIFLLIIAIYFRVFRRK
jgi:hypothetical protein